MSVLAREEERTMRQEPWLVIGPLGPLPHPPTRSGSSTLRLSELIARLTQLAQRLQHFQHRYGTHLSHADREWLYHAQQQVAFDLAEISQFNDTRAVAPKAPEPLQEVELFEQLARPIVQLAQAITQMVQTMPLPRQEPRRGGRAANTAEVPCSPTGADGDAVYGLLLVLGRHEQQGVQEEAADADVLGPKNGYGEPLADPGANPTDDQTHHHRKGASRPSLPQHEVGVPPSHAAPGIRIRRYHEMKMEERLEILGRLRRRIEGS
jgi:hypothetical protein